MDATIIKVEDPEIRTIELSRVEVINKLYQPPPEGRWLLVVAPDTLKARIVLQQPDGYVPDVEGHEDLFPLLMTLEREDGFVEGGDWLVAYTPNKRENDGIYRSYWIRWTKEGEPGYATFVGQSPIQKNGLTPSTTVSESSRVLRVFLCHSSGDKAVVRKLYQELSNMEWIDLWLDEEKLLPGQDWRQEITKAIRSTDIVIVCLSRDSVRKTGFVQKEINYALDIADEQPEGKIFIIPLKLGECDIPERLRRWQWVNFFEARGYNQLMRALQFCFESKGLALDRQYGRE